MMGRSHVLIGLSVTGVAVAAGMEPLSPSVLVAAAIGSLAPDVDTPYLVLGRMLPFVSHPLYRMVGHRTATHSVVGTGAACVTAILLEYAGLPFAGLSFLLGYILHIAADAITAEGVATLYPFRKRRTRLWPRVRTGGVGEQLSLGVILCLTVGCIYSLHPHTLDLRHFLPRL